MLLCGHHIDGTFTLRLHLHIIFANVTVMWAAAVTGSKSASAFEKIKETNTATPAEVQTLTSQQQKVEHH